ncbi:MAG: hypothetical protein K2P74_11140 [Nitrosomonas sp.]|nr:hypothetical protein [Nitrosomonas sp.]
MDEFYPGAMECCCGLAFLTIIPTGNINAWICFPVEMVIAEQVIDT